MSAFLIIPEKGTNKNFYIKTVDIINLIQDTTPDNESTLVTYKCGDRVLSIYTLLGGRELHTEIQRLETEDLKTFFGE